MSVLEELLGIVSASQLNADGVPSASIALLEDGQISSRVVTSGSEDTDTIYQACSISKAITALAVAKLVGEGRFTYDTLIVNHLLQRTIECVVDPATAHLMQSVTVKMLLSHTAGLTQGGFPGYAGVVPSAEDILAGRAPSNTPKVRFESWPGAQFSYSGGGFTVLQLFLESVMELPFPELMQKIVLQPLNMTRSHFGDLSSKEQNFAKSHYTAYTEANVPYHRFVELAAAGLWTTPTDLLQAVLAIQQSLDTDSGFLKRDVATQMLTTVVPTSLMGKMALGWALDDCIFAHRGSNDPGYNCYAFGSHGGLVDARLGGSSFTLPPHCGVAIMTNSAIGFETFRRIMNAIFYLKKWPRFGSLAGAFGDNDYVPYAAPRGTVISNDWQGWLGRWDDSDWELVNNYGPRLAFKGFAPLGLSPAATPLGVVGEKLEHAFVVDGIGTGVRLTWEGEEKVMVLLQSKGAKTLRRP